jgi:uncharacterized membrane protein YczE
MKEFTRRVLMTISGVCICGLSVGFFSYSSCGLDPFQVFAHGLWNLTTLDFGTFYAILNIILIVVILLVDRSKVGLGTVINLFGVGYMAEFSEWMLRRWNASPSWTLRIISLAIGVVVMCFASALYFTADLGVSTYDAVALIISQRTPLKFFYVRVACDLLCVLIGWIFGGTVGVGTIITAFFMGPMITFFNNTAAIPMRYGKKGKP